MADKIETIKEYIHQNPSATRDEIARDCKTSLMLLKDLKDKGIISYPRKMISRNAKLNKNSPKIIKINQYIKENTGFVDGRKNLTVKQISEHFNMKQQTIREYMNKGLIDRNDIVGSQQWGKYPPIVDIINDFIKENEPTFSEVVNKFGLSIDTIRLYEKNGIITKMKRSHDSTRLKRTNIVNNYIQEVFNETGYYPYPAEILKNCNIVSSALYRYIKLGLIDSSKIRKRNNSPIHDTFDDLLQSEDDHDTIIKILQEYNDARNS